MAEKTKMMKKQRLFYLMIAFGLVLASTGCAKTEPAASPASPDVKDHYKELLAKDKHLFRQNKELRNQLLQLQSKRAEDKKDLDKKIRHLNKTIQLLELNLNQLKSRQIAYQKQLSEIPRDSSSSLSVPPSEKMPAGKGDVDLSENSDHFVTPDDSKAINTIPLLSNDLAAVPVPVPIPEPSGRSKVKEESSNDQSAFLTGKTEKSWEDPDLTPPSNPIRLKTISGAKRSYQKAFKSFSNRDFTEAIKQFSRFLVRYPNDLDADNSQYWIGQAFYQKENYLEAENSFRKVLRNYEHKETKIGYKTPDAILMLGRIYMNRNKPIKGQYYFEQVIERFPTSRSAAKAKREIQSMKIF